MKAVSEKVLEQYEAVALEALSHIKRALAYEGNEPRYMQKGKLALGAVTNYTRLRSSESGRMLAEVASQRALSEGVTTKALTAARK